MAARSRILSWGIPWKEEPGRLQSMVFWSVGRDLATKPPPATVHSSVIQMGHHVEPGQAVVDRGVIKQDAVHPQSRLLLVRTNEEWNTAARCHMNGPRKLYPKRTKPDRKEYIFCENTYWKCTKMANLHYVIRWLGETDVRNVGYLQWTQAIISGWWKYPQSRLRCV